MLTRAWNESQTVIPAATIRPEPIGSPGGDHPTTKGENHE